MRPEGDDLLAELDPGDRRSFFTKPLISIGTKRAVVEAWSTTQTPVRLPSFNTAPTGTATSDCPSPLRMLIVTVAPSGAEAASPSST